MHHWHFHRIGGFDQVALRDGADLENLHLLDQKLWVALACPVKGLELDEKTLALLDTDQDGRIRAPDILAAIARARPCFKDLGVLLSGEDRLPLSAFADTPEGRAALASARRILSSLGKPDSPSITLAEAADTARLFAAARLNGDGVVVPASAEDPALAALIADIVAATGGVPDRSGAAGVSQALADRFFADAAAFVAWTDQGASPGTLTLGPATAAATAAVAPLRAKIDDWFARASLAAFDPRSLPALNPSEADYLALAGKHLGRSGEEIAALPLARVAPDRPLPLLEDVNPAWADRLAALHRDAVAPAFGPALASLDEERWRELKARTDAFAAHLAARPAGGVEKLGVDRLRALLADAGALRPALAALLAQERALAPEFDAIADVERLLRYARDFRALLANYVNFFDFYSPDRLAVFQAGTLYLDTRSTELCVEVAAVTPLAAMGRIFIAYCDIRRAGCPPRKIAACFTQGDGDYLFVGRNGLFYDRQGRDWDATIAALADNPISIRQAFFSPYKKFVRLVEEQIARRAAAADADADARLAAAAGKTVHADKTRGGPAEPAKIDVGTVAALGVAVGAIGGALGAVATGLAKLDPLQLPLVPLGLVLVVSGPSVVIAWLKLRQRTLGPLLEANGWAVNARVKITIPFGARLTERARKPARSTTDLHDPCENKRAARRLRVRLSAALLLLAAAAAIAAATWQVWPFAP